MRWLLLLFVLALSGCGPSAPPAAPVAPVSTRGADAAARDKVFLRELPELLWTLDSDLRMCREIPDMPSNPDLAARRIKKAMETLPDVRDSDALHAAYEDIRRLEGYFERAATLSRNAKELSRSHKQDDADACLKDYSQHLDQVEALLADIRSVLK
jgi:hypothetical protein